MKIKAIITGSTGMVGEGVLKESSCILMWKKYWLLTENHAEWYTLN